MRDVTLYFLLLSFPFPLMTVFLTKQEAEKTGDKMFDSC